MGSKFVECAETFVIFNRSIQSGQMAQSHFVSGPQEYLISEGRLYVAATPVDAKDLEVVALKRRRVHAEVRNLSLHASTVFLVLIEAARCALACS